MKHNTPYNKSLFKPSRLVHFQKKTEKQQESERMLMEEQNRQVDELNKSTTPHAKELAAKFREGKIDAKMFERAQKIILMHPGRLDEDQYRFFMQALIKGKFSDGGKIAGGFLDIIERGKKDPANDADFNEYIQDLSKDDSAALTGSREKAKLKELTDIRHAKEMEKTQKTNDTKSAVLSAVSETTKTKERLYRNYVDEEASPELLATFEEHETILVASMRTANTKSKELHEAMGSKNPDEAGIAKLKKELVELDRKIDEAQTILDKEWLDYSTRKLSRKEALERFIKRSGIDIRNATKLRAWLIDGNADTEGFKIPGVYIDPETGHATKTETDIEILSVYYDKEKEDSTAQAPGELMIEFRDETGTKQKVDYRYFFDLINTFEDYEECESIDELNERLNAETNYAGVAEGQEYSIDIITNLDDSDKPVSEQISFTIESIDEEKGTITLDQNMLKTSRLWLPKSVHPSLYFDRRQQTYSYGEFAKFVKQQGFKRKLTADETAEACDKAGDALNAEIAQYGDSAFPKFTPPKDGETTNVVFLDKSGRRRDGTMTRKGEDFIFDEIPFQATGSDDALPMAFQAARSGSTGRWTRKRMPARSLLDAANLGQLANAIPTGGVGEPGGPGDGDNVVPPGGTGGPSGAGEPEEPEEAGVAIKEEKKGREESLAYNDVFKTGGMDQKQRSYLVDAWKETRFLSVNDIWELGKAMWEYYDNRWKRRQKERFSSVAQDLPFWSPEMKRINQAAENEQVNQFKESFDQMGVYEIQGRLQDTGNRDELKAAYVTLSEKGQLRWDDIDMWRNLNSFVGANVAIPIPRNGDPYNRLSDTDERTGFDYLKGAIDSLWGEGTYNEWYSKNKSTYQSNAKGYYEEGKELEGVEGGHGRRLGELLRQHKNGEYVDPHEYEGLLLQSIEFGKARMQEKLYYMIEGVAAENQYGRTIMSFDRISHINSEMLPRFPLLEYVCASVERDGGTHRWTKDDYKNWINTYFDKGDRMNCSPSAGVDEFLWKFVLPSDETQNRINKALRHADQNMDHDDMFGYIPPATEEVVTDTCKSASGSKKFLTIEGYANAFPGFSQYIRSTSENGQKNKLREGLISYVRFQGIMTDKYQKGDTNYQRMDPDTLESATIVSTQVPQAYINQLDKVVKAIAAAYGDQELIDIVDLLYTEVDEDLSIRSNKDKQDKINAAYKKFNRIFSRVVSSDKGAKMTTICAGSNLEGMPFTDSATLARRKAEFSSERSLE